MGLVRAYEAAFETHGLRAAQILLTHEDVTDRGRYLNARGTLKQLLELGVVPVVNENDTVATDEIRFGDNDTLSALTVNLVEAEVLVLLTDQDGLFDSDPRNNPDAKLVSEAELSDPLLTGMAGDSKGELGRGGMRTKLTAAHWAARSGAMTVIAHGRTPNALLKIAQGEPLGTLLKPARSVMASRKRWIAGQLQLRGRLTLDDGAVRVLREQGRSLLPVGVKAVDGSFERGDLVACIDAAGHEIARGLVNYPAADAQRIVGAASSEISGRLGYPGEAELIHRDNLVLTAV
jgi:glutamate 5-kinase